jgi:hypothetical protein
MAGIATLVAVALASPRAAQAPAVDTSTKAIVKAAAAYVDEYQKTMANVVAGEEYHQQVLDAAGHVRQERLMNGDLYLTYIDGDHEWFNVHDVAMVDGEPVSNREDINKLLATKGDRSVRRQVQAHNASFNIGELSRDFNEPTLALTIFNKGHIENFSFDRKSVVKSATGATATLAFKEDDTITLARTKAFRPLPFHGQFEIDLPTGRIVKSVIQFANKPEGTTGELTTEYALDAKVDLWVPKKFTEWYERKIADRFERIECTATYSNFRRWGVKVIIR